MTDDLRDCWALLRVPDSGCCVCGAKYQVTWRCAGCHRLVCQAHTLCQPTAQNLEPHAGGTEYYELTLCSVRCWERMGRPEE